MEKKRIVSLTGTKRAEVNSALVSVITMACAVGVRREKEQDSLLRSGFIRQPFAGQGNNDQIAWRTRSSIIQPRAGLKHCNSLRVWLGKCRSCKSLLNEHKKAKNVALWVILMQIPSSWRQLKNLGAELVLALENHFFLHQNGIRDQKSLLITGVSLNQLFAFQDNFALLHYHVAVRKLDQHALYPELSHCHAFQNPRISTLIPVCCCMLSCGGEWSWWLHLWQTRAHPFARWCFFVPGANPVSGIYQWRWTWWTQVMTKQTLSGSIVSPVVSIVQRQSEKHSCIYMGWKIWQKVFLGRDVLRRQTYEHHRITSLAALCGNTARTTKKDLLPVTWSKDFVIWVEDGVKSPLKVWEMLTEESGEVCLTGVSLTDLKGESWKNWICRQTQNEKPHSPGWCSKQARIQYLLRVKHAHKRSAPTKLCAKNILGILCPEPLLVMKYRSLPLNPKKKLNEIISN